MPKYLLAIDQGTTSSRAMLFDQTGNAAASVQQEFTQHFPKDGWVEHNPAELISTTIDCCRQVIAKQKIKASDIIAIGITNQRETVVLWDKHSGKPIYNAIVWQDRRTSKQCNRLKRDGLEPMLNQKTGLLADPYFSATKIQWVLDNIDGARLQADSGQLLCGTVDTFLLWHLTGGRSHKTDATNASRTLLFNIHTQQWDTELLSLFNIPESLLPEVMDSADNFGMTAAELFGSPIPISAMAGDQQAALFGQACFEPGMAKSTYGTGCFLMLNTGKQMVHSQHQLLTTVGYRIKGETSYALEGSIFVAGAAIQWLRDGLTIIQGAAETEGLAKQVTIDHGVYMVPAFTGLGAPYWDADARGAILGLTRDTGIAEIVSAALQAIAYQTKDLQNTMAADGTTLTHLKVDGGMAANGWFLQFLADILQARVDVPSVIETTAQGVAYMAGLQAGVFSSLSHIEQLWQLNQCYEPAMGANHSKQLYHGWQQAIKRVKTHSQ